MLEFFLWPCLDMLSKHPVTPSMSGPHLSSLHVQEVPLVMTWTLWSQTSFQRLLRPAAKGTLLATHVGQQSL